MPSIFVVVLLAIILVSFLNLKGTTGSVFNISELDKKIDLVQPGDIINYEINGYNDWQVLRKDKYNGTVDVISRTNVKNITFDYTNSATAPDVFREEASAFTDNKYAVSAREASSDDNPLIAYQDDFWLSPITDKIINSTKGKIDLSNFENGKITFLPYLQIMPNDFDEYNFGDEYPLQAEGINSCFVLKKEGNTLYLVPSKPIEIEVTDVEDNIISLMNSKLYTISSTSNIDVGSTGFASDTSRENTMKLIKRMFDETSEKTYVVTSSSSCYSNDDNYISTSCSSVYLYDGELESDYGGKIWKKNGYVESKTLGFRPVVTLKYGDGEEGKALNTKLKIGDYVKYSAKGYNSWRVLSINEEEGTAEIISGGAVKNITFVGKDGYDNAIVELQNEADQYKSGEKAIKARVINELDYDNLIKVKIKNGSVISYWTSDKTERTNDLDSYYSVGIYDNGLVSSGGNSSYGNGDFKYISLYKYQKSGELYGKLYTSSSDEYRYTAGLRPIITVRLDSVEKVDEDELKKVEKTEQVYNNTILKEQNTKNKEYNDLFNGNSEKEYTSSTDSNNSQVSTSLGERCCTDNGLLKILVIISCIICILVAIQTVNSSFILKYIMKDKK